MTLVDAARQLNLSHTALDTLEKKSIQVYNDHNAVFFKRVFPFAKYIFGMYSIEDSWQDTNPVVPILSEICRAELGKLCNCFMYEMKCEMEKHLVPKAQGGLNRSQANTGVPGCSEKQLG